MINETEPSWTEVRQNEQQDFITTILTYAEAHKKPTAEDYNALELYWEGGALEQAMQTAHDLQQPRTVIRLAWALCNSAHGYLRVRGHWKALGQFLPWAREAAQQVGDEYDATVFNNYRANLLYSKGELDAARQIYEESLAIWLKQGNQGNAAVVYHLLGMIANNQQDYETAKNKYEQALAIYEKLDDQLNLAKIYHALGNLADDEGDTATAKRMYEQALEIHKQLGNQALIAAAIGELATLARKAGDLPQAEAMYRQAIEILEQVGDVVNLSIYLFNLALLYEAQGRLAEAVPLLERVVAIDEKVGLPDLESDRKVLARVRGKMNEELGVRN